MRSRSSPSPRWIFSIIEYIVLLRLALRVLGDWRFDRLGASTLNLTGSSRSWCVYPHKIHGISRYEWSQTRWNHSWKATLSSLPVCQRMPSVASKRELELSNIVKLEEGTPSSSCTSLTPSAHKSHHKCIAYFAHPLWENNLGRLNLVMGPNPRARVASAGHKTTGSTVTVASLPTHTSNLVPDWHTSIGK
jgi:hypothetical protein